jgi:hypothetical protein
MRGENRVLPTKDEYKINKSLYLHFIRDFEYLVFSKIPAVQVDLLQTLFVYHLAIFTLSGPSVNDLIS